MRTKILLTSGVSLFLFCTAISTSFAQAEDYVTKSQINAANGVAGLNGNKEITANTLNSSVKTDYVQLNKYNDRLRFLTNSPNTNSNMVDMFYNRDLGPKDDLGNVLDPNTFYFTDNKYGAIKYKFNGDVATIGDMIVQGNSVARTVKLADKAIPGDNEVLSPYNDNVSSPLIFLSKWGYDWGNIKPNTLMIGGNTRNSVVGIKATCQTTSGGDEGGTCYQFTNMSGAQTFHRSGAGLTDGINMDLRTADNSPLDVIGGNTLITNSNGTYDVKGNDYSVSEAVNAGANSFKVQGTFGCGIGDAQSGCKMTGIKVLDENNKEIDIVKVTPGNYDSINDISTVKLPVVKVDGKDVPYKLANSLTKQDVANITFYSADGVAYAIGFVKEGTTSRAIIAPTLSTKEANLITPRISIWTNIANGMITTEGGTDEDASNIDMPNYYYGYNGLVHPSDDIKHNISKIDIQTAYYPNTSGTFYGWRKLTTDIFSNPNLNSPGQNTGDQLDYKLTYTHPATQKLTYNSNYHRYSQPALFIGLSNKNFNLYADQIYNHAPDAITRDYDNEWDFVMPSDRDGKLQTRGLTLGWATGAGINNFAHGSYMLRLAGGGHMPKGIDVGGAIKNGGRTYASDSGFSIFNFTQYTENAMKNVNDIMTFAALGQATVNQGGYQLLSYLSKDGTDNTSLHFGLTKKTGNSISSKSLGENSSPTCNGNSNCSVLGQVIFDPLGYQGGIALGSGHGDQTKLGMIVDKDSNVIVNNKLTVNGKSVNDVVDNALVKSQVNVANGVVGLNGNKEVTEDISNNKVNSKLLQLSSTSTGSSSLRVLTGEGDSNNLGIDFYYNRVAHTDGWNKQLKASTFYFSNHHYGNNYEFNGDVATTGKITAGSNLIVTNRIETPNLRLALSTPSSSSAACTVGDIKDDANYHYVCVSTNKWKRAALSDF